MKSGLEGAIEACVVRLLTPLVRVLLRHGVPFGSFAEIAKRVYVDVAMSEFAIARRKATVSRASVITGLSRKEVHRIRELPAVSEERSIRSYNRAIRVVSGWVRDPRFADPQGQPAVLPFEGEEGSFSALVRRYSGDATPRAVLDELVRVGAVEFRGPGAIGLIGRAYVPREGEEEKIAILGNDVADLIDTIDFNLQVPSERSRFQLKVSYDNLPQECLGPFRSLSSRESLRLLESFDAELARHDRDANPDSKGTGRVRAGVAIYYFEEKLTEAVSENGREER